MIYEAFDDHPLIKAIRKKGWVCFEVYGNRATELNGMSGGWWIDTAVSYGTEHFESHKVINDVFLGTTLKEAIKMVKSDKFKTNK